MHGNILHAKPNFTVQVVSYGGKTLFGQEMSSNQKVYLLLYILAMPLCTVHTSA